MGQRIKYTAIVTLFVVICAAQEILALPFAVELNTQPLTSNIISISEFNQLPDTTQLVFPIPPSSGISGQPQSPLHLAQPSNITYRVEYNPATKTYTVYEQVGGINVALPKVMTEAEYQNFQFQQSMRSYWRERQAGESVMRGSGILPRLQVGGETFDRIFGSNVIEIIPQGTAELIFGITTNRTDNPSFTEDMRSNTTFDFQSKIQMNVVGNIGEKLKLDIKYNTEATFDFENNVKVEYTGFEDEIIQKIEAGNVSLPLPGTLITGSHSLFGVKTQLRFGKLTVTSIFSRQNGESQVIDVKGGAQVKDFSFQADEYEVNRHFFLSKYFRDTYNKSLENLPIVNSGVTITRVEVWVTNKSNNFDNSRNIIAFVDLGESRSNIHNPLFSQPPYPASLQPNNELNPLYLTMTQTYAGIRDISNVNSVLAPLIANGFVGGTDFEKLENARKLTPNEYSFHPQLGYVSLNMSLNSDEILAVAYEYTYAGRTFKVGELSTSGVPAPEALFVKLLKGTNLSPKMPTWGLMMKNIYSLGAYQVDKQDFTLNVLYQNDITGTSVNYIPEGGINIENKPLISVLNLDNLNSNNDAGADGMFDFIEGITIKASTGRLIFPVLEPFGSDLRSKISTDDIAKKYVYQELYDSTLAKARQVAEKNKFRMVGSYQSSSSSEISLNAPNVPKGSVTVTAGGAKLVEGMDFTVDYLMGTVKIINPVYMQSGTPIKISLESQALFNFQTKTLIGSHFDYKFSDNFNAGATIMNLTERPFTKKVSFGNEAISNTIWGLNTSYRTESPLLTKMVDWLPFIQTKEKSTITFDAEFAQFIPGHSSIIGKAGTVQVDDFEGGKTAIDLRSQFTWMYASTPQGQQDIFPEGYFNDELAYNYNRAKLAWYIIDPLFLRNNSLTPGYIRRNPNLQSSHFVREIFESEIFPNRNSPQGIPTNISVLNLAFYPKEAGSYNYTTNVNENGALLNPQGSWGGIMRSLPDHAKDFETANIEYVEFWLMDPFVYSPNSTGGDLFFNLGDISEDILRDGKKFFEQGLPQSGETQSTGESAWGRFPTTQMLINAFSSDNRQFQDVGLDGLTTEAEKAFFADYLTTLRLLHGENSKAYQDALNDPSNDNYRYYQSDIYDAQEASILDRYKYYNNLDGNSPVSNNEQYSNLPDAEDVDGDKTMSETENYYQYRISLRPHEMVVGQNFITDKVTYNARLANGERSEVSWYQFKVPKEEWDRKVGTIDDFKSIRFMRMFLRGFQDTVILRFATLDLVKSEWRKYNRALVQGQEGMPTGDFPDGTFEVSVVNIEENNTRTPVNYVLPPGVERITDPSQPQLTELNEQALQLKVVDLANGDARAVFKSVTYDIRQYKRLQMYVHAEAIPGIPINNHELTAFIRLGTDYSNNYYEYEIPLALTPAGTYSNNRETDRLMVWPNENYIDIELERLIDAKLNRNVDMQKPGSQVTYTTVYVEADGNRKIKVTGNPSLSNVKVLMVGIRNPNSSATDDGIPKSGIVWVNELRLTQFNDKGGWAANARVTTKLADLATVNASGETYKPGFGSIEKKVNERSLDDFYQYDLSSTIQVGRFFSEKPIVNIPLFVGYNESFANPEYNPLDPDVPLKDALEKATNKAARDSINKISQEYSRRKSLSLTNVKINKSEGTPMPWDISNFAVSYAYSDQLNRNIRTEHRIQRNVRGSLTYSYNIQTKKVEPFKKVKWLSNPYLRLIKDFNFSYLPNQLAFRTELNRNYFEQQLRNISTTNAASSANITLLPTYSKDFTWNRNYVFSWELSDALKFEFTANNNARIDEPLGIVDKYKDRDAYEQWKDSVWTNLKNLGRNINYNHQFSLTYNIPINKIPLFNWVTATGRYNGSYNWVAAPILAANSTFDPGNTIQNSNNIQLSSQLSFTSLYNKSGYLKKINQKFDQRARGTQKQPKMLTVKQEIENVSLRENMARNIDHNLKTDNVTVKVFDESNNEVKVDLTVRSKSRIALKSEKAVAKAKVVIEGKVPETESTLQFITEGAIRMLMGIKTVSGNYTETNGTLLPGYKPKTEYLGMTDWGNTYAPGFPFVAGWQNEQFAWDAIRNGWLSNDTSLNQATVFSHNRTLDFRANIEPIPAFRIDLVANRSFSENRNDYYVANGLGGFNASQPMYTGNFSISTITIGSAFEKVSEKNGSSSETFERFKEIRRDIALRFAAGRIANPAFGYDPNKLDSVGFPDGYGQYSQEVLRQAFLAAYTNKSAETVGLAAFPAIPLPNWSVTYDGLAKLKFFKKYLRTFSLRHTYRSTYTIGNYTTNLDYYPTSDGFSYVRNTLRDLVAHNDITNISISEQFNPLFGIDLGWNSSLTNKVEIKNSRTLSMSFSNNQLTEMRNWEYVVGVGYRFENLPLKFGRASGEERTLKSDLRVNTDFSLRKSTTILRKIEDNLSTPTAGQNILTIKTSAEYVVSEQVTVRLYFDRVVNKPVTSLTYPMANTSFGFSVRFTLVQ